MNKERDMSITKDLFDRLSDGTEVFAYTLKNGSGMSAVILSYGGIIQQLNVADKNGSFADVVGGYDTVSSYINGGGYHGALIGRFGNRIADGRFTLEGKTYSLAANNGKNHLHGGLVGYDARIWEAEEIDGDEPELVLCLVSEDGEEGYPGRLEIKVTYKLTSDNALSINYKATTDKSTPINLTNHAYFNLAGFDNGNIHTHDMWLDADSYLATDDGLIPTGDICSVEGTPFDFRAAKPIGRDIDADDEAIVFGGGYDHCFNFVGGETGKVELRGSLYDPESGRLMEMYTDQPCVQVYTANGAGNDEYPQKGGFKMPRRSFVCLETQKMPDSINHANFTDCVLRPGEVYDYTTVYKFSVR